MLNRAKKDSIRYSIRNLIENIHSINYSFNRKKIIQFNIQFKIESKIFIQIGKITSALENSEKHAKWAVFSSKRTFYSFFLWISLFFDSFKNSFKSTTKIFIQRIYSFNSTEKYSFKECIHSKNNQIIHSMKIFIFFKNAVSATPRGAWLSLICAWKEVNFLQLIF